VPRCSSHLNSTRLRVSDRVSHRILDDRLQDQVGHAHVQHFGIDSNLSSESILKANPLDLEIPVQEFDLLLQCNLHRSRILECQPEKVAQSGNHFSSAIGILAE